MHRVRERLPVVISSRPRRRRPSPVKYAAAWGYCWLFCCYAIYSDNTAEDCRHRWFDAMAQRSCGKAAGYHTDAAFHQPGVSTPTQCLNISSTRYTTTRRHTVRRLPIPRRAIFVIVTWKYPDQRGNPVNLVKMGRRWLIDSVYN